MRRLLVLHTDDRRGPVDPGTRHDPAIQVREGSGRELEPYRGYALKESGLQPHYHLPTIIREALEEYLVGRPSVAVERGRLYLEWL